MLVGVIGLTAFCGCSTQRIRAPHFDGNPVPLAWVVAHPGSKAAFLGPWSPVRQLEIPCPRMEWDESCWCGKDDLVECLHYRQTPDSMNEVTGCDVKKYIRKTDIRCGAIIFGPLTDPKP